MKILTIYRKQLTPRRESLTMEAETVPGHETGKGASQQKPPRG